MAGGGLVFEGPLPLRWQVEPESLEAAAAAVSADLQHANLRTLGNILLLEDLAFTRREEQLSGTASDLERVELKLNLILELIEQLVSTQSGLPAALELRITPTSLAWRAAVATVPAPGSTLRVAVFLHPGYPVPFAVRGTAQVTELPCGGQAEVQVAFHELGERVCEQLEKFIFRQHRRQVAALRQPRL